MDDVYIAATRTLSYLSRLPVHELEPRKAFSYQNVLLQISTPNGMERDVLTWTLVQATAYFATQSNQNLTSASFIPYTGDQEFGVLAFLPMSANKSSSSSDILKLTGAPVQTSLPTSGAPTTTTGNILPLDQSILPRPQFFWLMSSIYGELAKQAKNGTFGGMTYQPPDNPLTASVKLNDQRSSQAPPLTVLDVINALDDVTARCLPPRDCHPLSCTIFATQGRSAYELAYVDIISASSVGGRSLERKVFVR
ncbi:uncharacterized protein KY384_004693 [Bacidia gigantensis]|uniref:uncharacterized protein n=1 Tax=Bacidia gigantensis TaxID=2732470 RepID=UPI001D04B141|nr:uncharacterized protein KY384_004693 [Bacidia gigantensis]KAG8530193.1 hypothetical protein KY384_004693 [Bacidia gigantensis]